jgi:hypothetical protein
MTTNKLAKLYAHLTPRERLPLLISAGVRGDEVERERLVGSAPRVCYKLADYHGLVDSFATAMLMHLVERLDLGARFMAAVGILEMQGATDTPKARARADRFEVAVHTMALRFCIEVDGWKLFCADLNLDPDALLPHLPAYHTVSEMERLARMLANTPDEATAYLRKTTGSESAQLPTPDEVAESYRELLALGERPWQ